MASKNQADLLADVVREKREIQRQRLFNDINDEISVRQKRSPEDSEDKNVVVLPENPFPGNNFQDLFGNNGITILSSSVVQPRRHSPHVAKGDLNVATESCSKIDL